MRDLLRTRLPTFARWLDWLSSPKNRARLTTAFRRVAARLTKSLRAFDRAPAARFVLNAPVFGALYVLLLWAWFAREPIVPADDVLFGRDAKEIASRVSVQFSVQIRDIGLQLAAAAVVVGVAFGVCALGLLTLRERIQGHPPARRAGFRAAFSSVLIVAGLHTFSVLLSMSRWPQLYSRYFWSRGGVLATIQRLATDRLQTRGCLLVLGVALGLLLIGPPWHWPRRVVAAASLVWRRPKVWLIGPAVGLGGAVAAGLYVREAPLPSSRGAAGLAQAQGVVPRRRSVLVIASDGLRPDRLRPEIAPHLSALAARGTRFDRAYVDVPRTMSSWATLLTGLHPHHHGLRSGFPTWNEVSRPLDTVPRRLRALGYQTAAVTDYAGEVFARADFGFNSLDVPPANFTAMLRERAIERSVPLLPFLQSRGGRALFPEVALWSGAADPRFVASAAIRELRRIDQEPFFMVVFFSTTHFPYAAPAPYHARFTRPDYKGPFRYDKTVMATVPIMPDAADVVQIRGLYDGAVAAVDDAAATILDEVERLRGADDVVIVLTADHGELLFENDRWHGHGDHLFGDESTHIPMVIVDSRSAPHVEHALVASVDLAPTLYDLLGVAPPEQSDGRSLAPALRGEAIASRPVFAETELSLGVNPGLAQDLQTPAPGLATLLTIDTEHGNVVAVQRDALDTNLVNRHRMVRDDRWKLLYIPTPRGVVYRLFDTLNDPEELDDALDAHPREAARLKDLLWTWMLDDPRLTRRGDRLVVKSSEPAPSQPPSRP